MKVQVENNFYIESDSFQFILKEYTGNMTKEGVPTFKTHGYFPNVSGALEKFLTLKIKESTATSLRELIAEVKGIREYIREQVDF
ncbi:hypothetical protein [Paenibacillus sp. PDC88]|uniref:hypothetical protein n=1 Tax=Paenibacillus sp. PDC88 TaxID=1884375 RepID=UPI00089C1DE0|nr:hypothetical protein [Paenibacillus sp. PDC88]SDX04843.1 hypothetical protein SAMN05518848_104188 [Paenibacillus sp. PDC88]